MDIRTAFAVLGLDETATDHDIRSAYRDLIKVWHPDRFPGNTRLQHKATEMLRQINDAYRLVRSRRDAPRQTEASSSPPESPPPTAPSVPQTQQPRILLWASLTLGAATLLATAIPILSSRSTPSPSFSSVNAKHEGRSYADQIIFADAMEGAWYLNDKIMLFHQGTVQTLGNTAAVGYYDVTGPGKIIYRQADSSDPTVVDVDITSTTMRWRARESAGQPLILEFIRD